MNYKAMTTAELKRECIERCKNKNMPSSWIQMAKNSERIDFLKYGIFPNEDKPKEKEKEAGFSYNWDLTEK